MPHPTQRIAPPDSLRRRFELDATQVTIADQAYELLRPKSVDDLISEEDFAIDERIPYWAECWPSARVLAERVAREAARGRRLLELGCGIGLVSLVAANGGCRVLATDYYADALEFTAANAQRHGLRRIDTRLVDWRKFPKDLGVFDLVAASDVLYERAHAELIAAALAGTLATGGLGLVSDPGRRTAPALVEECSRLGLTAACVEQVPTHDAGAELMVSIYAVRRA